jgi:hypothetical protein
VVAGMGRFRACAGSPDVDCDGRVAASDARVLLRALAGYSVSATCPAVRD